MKYCHYHPLSPATWYCPRCHTDTCDCCSDESVNLEQRHCFQCGAPLESLGSAYTAEPFWEHLTEIFRYPLRTSVMALIVVVSVIGTALSFLPVLGVLATLVSAGIFFKYSFRCLEETAGGNMVPPDITDAYSGGLLIIVKLFLLMIGVGVLIGAAGWYLGNGVAGLLTALVMLSLPAFLTNFVVSDSILYAASPLNNLRIIAAIGLPYGLLIGLLMLMASSVSFLSYLMISGWEWLTIALISVVSNYYMLVMFHLMGYVVFQYQQRLGFSAREELGIDAQPRSEIERLRAQISVLVKHGNYSKALTIYRHLLERYRQDVSLQDEYFEFLVLTASRDVLQGFADDYLLLKTERGHLDQLKRIYRHIRSLLPDFIPADGEVRYQVAKQFAALGEYSVTVHLINGMHRQHTDLELLIRSYSLLEEALEGLDKQDLVASCRAFLAQLRSKQSATLTVQKPAF